MNEFQGIHHTGLTVSDLDRSIAFYTGVLGCELVMTQEKQGGYLAAIVGYEDAHLRTAHVRLPGDQHVIELSQYISPASHGKNVMEPSSVGNAHIAFIVEDLESVYETLVNAAVDVFGKPVMIDTGVNAGGWGLYFRDPDGITLELFQRPSVQEG